MSRRDSSIHRSAIIWHVCRLHHSAPLLVVIVIFRVAVAMFRDVEPGVGQFLVEHHGH